MHPTYSIRQARSTRHGGWRCTSAVRERKCPCKRITRLAAQNSGVLPELGSYEALLGWASSEGHTLAMVSQDAYGGRCLLAARDVAPGEPILSVPLQKVFASKTPSELEVHWSADLAFGLLSIQHHHQLQQQAGSTEGMPPAEEVDWSYWLACLPREVPTLAEFSKELVQQLALHSMIESTCDIRDVLEACYLEVEPQLEEMGYDWDDWLWAVQVLHSRCFFDPTMQQHLCVPGVDMANHSFNPTAEVRVLHNPDSCQGVAAVEEVAPVDLLAQQQPQAPSCFQLLAGEGGLKEGQEITISYGPWPQEVFLQMFGFLPEPNPYDAIVLYVGLQDMADHYAHVLASLQSNKELVGGVDCIVETPLFRRVLRSAVLRIAGPETGMYYQMVARAEGLDGRLQRALSMVTGAAMGAVHALQLRPIDPEEPAGEEDWEIWHGTGYRYSEAQVEQYSSEAAVFVSRALAAAGITGAQAQPGSSGWRTAVEWAWRARPEVKADEQPLDLTLGEVLEERLRQLQEQLQVGVVKVEEKGLRGGGISSGVGHRMATGNPLRAELHASLVRRYKASKLQLLRVVMHAMGVQR